METVHNAIAWYQKKIGSYDKQLWEESVEKKLLKVPPNVKNAPKKSVRLKTEYIDVDLIRGSTFTKTKPQVPWIYITRKAIVRVIFFPFYYKWWVLQTSVKLYLLLLVLYFLQLISIVVYLRNLDHSIVEDELSFTEVTIPVILMFLLCLVHSQTVLAHISHKPPKRTKPIARVIRPQKTKKPTRKGLRSSGNNSSACQDDSCTSSRSAKTNHVNKRQSDISLSSSSATKQQISQNETFSFPEMSKSNINTGSSSESNISALPKSAKVEEKSLPENIFHHGVKEGRKVKDNGDFIPVAAAGSYNVREEQKHSPTGENIHINRVSSLGFEPTSVKTLDEDELVVSTEICEEDVGEKSVHIYQAHKTLLKPESRHHLSSSSSSSLSTSTSSSATSSVFQTNTTSFSSGNKKTDLMSAENNSQGCDILHNVDISVIGNVLIHGNSCIEKIDSPGADNCAGEICQSDGRRLLVNSKGLKSGPEELNGNQLIDNSDVETTVHGKSVCFEIGISDGNDKVTNSNSERVSSNEIPSCQGHTISTFDSPSNEKITDCGAKEYCYHYYSSNVTDDSGIHSNLSSTDSVYSCLSAPNQNLERFDEDQLSVRSQHSKKMNRDSQSITIPNRGHSLFPLNDEEDEENLSQPSSPSSSSLSTQKENIIYCEKKDCGISSTITTASSSSSTHSFSKSTYCQSSVVNKCDINTDKDLNDFEKQQICSNHHHNHHQHHHHHLQDQQHRPHCHHKHQKQIAHDTNTGMNSEPQQLHSTSVESVPTASSSACGIECFSELFAQEILNSETLREVSSTILMNNSDLDCSSSSVTGPLSSASFSSSSSAFSTNNMFSLPLKETSSSTLTPVMEPPPISKRSYTPPNVPVTSTTTMASSRSNSHSTDIDSNNVQKENVKMVTTATTESSMTTPATSCDSTSHLNLPKRRHFENRLPLNQQIHRQEGEQKIQSGIILKTDSTNSMASFRQDGANLDESMDMDLMADMATTFDADRISDISNYSPSESDSDTAGMEDLRNRCEEKRRKQLRFQELNLNVHSGGGTNSGSLSPHLSGGSPKSISPNGANVPRSVVNALTRKPSPLKDLNLSRKLNGGASVQPSTHSSASDVGKSESTTRSCLRRRRRTSGNTVEAEMSRTRSVPSSIGISIHATQQDKNKMISSSENEGGEAYTAEGVNKATMSSEEWEDRIPLDESTSSNYSSSCGGNSDSEEVTRDGDEVEEEEEEKTEYTTSTLHVINLLQPQTGSPSNSGNTSQPDKVSCLIWEMNECKKVDLTALDIGWAIIDKVDSLPESSDYFIIGMLFSVLMGVVPLAFRGFVNKSWTNMEDLLSWSGLVNKTLDIPAWFLMYTWRQNLLMLNGILQRFFLSLLFFFLLSVADRTFKQRLLYAKHFSYLTSSRRARKFSMPHFRLNKVRNIKIWLSLRSYLKRRGPQRSVDVIVSASFMCGISVVCLISLQMLKDSGNYLDFLCNWELLVWCLALAVFLLRFMTLGLKINKKYRNLSVLITEQINLYLQMEQKPHKKEELILANNVLRLAEDLLKELESPFKISGFSANPFIYNITKVIVLSAFSAVLTELLGFKLKLHKIKLKG